MNYNPAKTGYPNLTEQQILAIDYYIDCLEEMREKEKARAEKRGRPVDSRRINEEALHLKLIIRGLEELSFICPTQRIEWFNKIGFVDA